MLLSFLKKTKKQKTDGENSPDAPNITLTQSRIPVSDLQLGMYVRELDRPWLETDFTFQGFTLETIEDIEAVKQQCEYVVVDFLTHQPKSQQNKGDRALLNSPTDVIDTKRFSKDLSDAGQVHTEAKQSIDRMFGELQLVKAVDGEMVKTVVNECVESILKNTDAILWYTQIQKKDSYLSQHSLNVAVLSVALGKHLDLRQQELEELGTCGLLHDVGKTSLPDELLQKKGEYTERERLLLKSHTVEGRNILISSKNVFSGAADVAFSHHENIDGTGYPRRLDGKKISLFSKIVAVADAYDNLINGDVFDQSRSTTEALQMIYDEKGQRFDNDLVLSFIECVGVYPPGTIIEMNSGEVGIVLSNNSNDKLHPRVILLLDEYKEPRPQRVIDLAKLHGTPESKEYRIKATLRNRSYDIDVEEYVRAGLRLEQQFRPAVAQ